MMKAMSYLFFVGWLSSFSQAGSSSGGEIRLGRAWQLCPIDSVWPPAVSTSPQVWSTPGDSDGLKTSQWSPALWSSSKSGIWVSEKVFREGETKWLQSSEFGLEAMGNEGLSCIRKEQTKMLIKILKKRHRAAWGWVRRRQSSTKNEDFQKRKKKKKNEDTIPSSGSFTSPFSGYTRRWVFCQLQSTWLSTWPYFPPLSWPCLFIKHAEYLLLFLVNPNFFIFFFCHFFFLLS